MRKPTGRLLPLGRQCPLVRSTALKSDCFPADPQETIAPVAYNLMLYRSFSGIWTQAAQNICESYTDRSLVFVRMQVIVYGGVKLVLTQRAKCVNCVQV
ncbi:hypothetical protein Tco_0373019 [Tanacetum coccineum]